MLRLLHALGRTLAIICWHAVVDSTCHDVRSAFLVGLIVREQVVHFGIDEVLNKLSGRVSLLREDPHDDVHDLRDHRWEALEDLADDLVGDLFQLLIGVLDQLKGWVLQLFQLRIDQEDEDVDGGEAWKAVSLVHLDGFLHVHIRVLASGLEAIEV